MKNLKSIFFLIYLLFHVAILVVSIYVNYRSDDFQFLFYLRNKMAIMAYVSALGLLLFFINLTFLRLDTRNNATEKAALEEEINMLKQKIAKS